MGLSKLPQKRSDGIEFIDLRDKLYFNKYKFRARFHCPGLHLLWWAKNESQLRHKVKEPRNKEYIPWVDRIIAFQKFKEAFKDTIRVEGGVAAVFSNDLSALKVLENIGCPIDYTEAKDDIPAGVKYFKNDPPHKYRFHLKSKRVEPDFHIKLSKWLDKYNKAGTVVTPCNSLKDWCSRPDVNNWRKMFTSSHYFIDYNDESTLTLFILCFDSMVQRKYQLLKKP